MAKKGREIKVHFTFVMDKFDSAGPLNLLIIYSIPEHQGHITLHFGCLYDSWKRLVSNDLSNSKISKVDLQTYQGKFSLD